MNGTRDTAYAGMQFEVDAATYAWTERLFDVLRKVLKVHFKVHHSEGQIEAGEIFLFNHFARFETFIPQYFIYKECGAYCRSVAGGEFFTSDDPFSRYLSRVGAIPNDLPALLPFLAREILRGRKVIVFPEGGMVKDRRVMDAGGGYSVYSRTARSRRKHHTGAAVLAIVLDTFKNAVKKAEARGSRRRIEEWSEGLELVDAEQLIAAANRPTLIVPANITFYPIRVSDNLLRKGAELLSRGLSRRLSEELLIEGNILLKETDMDIRLGEPVKVDAAWRWWERRLLARVVRPMDSLHDFFSLQPTEGSWDARLIARQMRKTVARIRDDYMHRMYTGVTVNLSHLASTLVLALLERGHEEMAHEHFHKLLYSSVKHAQREPGVHLHRSLRNPEAYSGLLEGHSARLADFFKTTTDMELLERGTSLYRFLPKLGKEHGFDEIRLENLIEVYANEAAPVAGVQRAVATALASIDELAGARLGQMRFEDEQRAYAWDKAEYAKPRYLEINEQETARASGEPYLLMPEQPKGVGVVVAHGFLASPAELRSLAEKLCALGFPVLAVRLKGHGTSPWDLRGRSCEDWLDSVHRGLAIMSCYTERVCLVGFSTGAALSLCAAAERPAGLAGVAGACVPFRFQDRNMAFVPLVHRANRLVRWVSSYEGVLPFRAHESEHPDINYYHMPIRGLYELRRLVALLDERLPKVECPVCLLQASNDPVVDPSSVEKVRAGLTLDEDALEVIVVESDRHGIVAEDIGPTHQHIIRFVTSLDREPAADTVGAEESLTR